jgi:hypothetical protein
MKIIKLPLLEFIEMLSDLYEEGVDYIDMFNSEVEGEENVIEIAIEEGYMMKEDGQEDDDTEGVARTRFIDNDINDLI